MDYAAAGHVQARAELLAVALLEPRPLDGLVGRTTSRTRGPISSQIAYYGRKSITVEGNPLLNKEIHLYRRKSLTIEEPPYTRLASQDVSHVTQAPEHLAAAAFNK